MRLAIVGSVSLWGDRLACDAICAAIDGGATSVVSGGAMGVDTMAEYIATQVYGLPVTVYRPKNERWAPEGYKDRNLLIAKDCTHLVRVYSVKSKTYGSGWTRDQAVKAGAQTYEVAL